MCYYSIYYLVEIILFKNDPTIIENLYKYLSARQPILGFTKEKVY